MKSSASSSTPEYSSDFLFIVSYLKDRPSVGRLGVSFIGLA